MPGNGAKGTRVVLTCSRRVKRLVANGKMEQQRCGGALILLTWGDDQSVWQCTACAHQHHFSARYSHRFLRYASAYLGRLAKLPKQCPICKSPANLNIHSCDLANAGRVQCGDCGGWLVYNEGKEEWEEADY